MTKLRILSAIGLSLAMAAATPAFARGMGHGGAGMGHAAAGPARVGGAGNFAAGPTGGARVAGGNYRGGYRGGGGGWGPGIAAGVVAGAALGAYGAGYGYPGYYGDSYAYDTGPGYTYDQGPAVSAYPNPNGFVCQPGTWFRGEDGRNHLCQ
jgi:hypothetical protein